MTEPDFRHGYLRIPLLVWKRVFCRAPLTRRQLQIVAVVIRESWGWQTHGGGVRTWTRPLSPGAIAEATGLSTDHLAQDMRALCDRGVLHEQAGCFQFVGDAGLWKTSTTSAPEMRVLPLFERLPGAESAPNVSSVKIPNTSQRNVRSTRGHDFSPTVENAHPLDVPPLPVRVAPVSPASPQRTALPETERFIAVLAAFVGDVTAAEADALRDWVGHAGTAAVWQTLEPAFRQGPTVTRQALHQHLVDRDGKSGETEPSPPC